MKTVLIVFIMALLVCILVNLSAQPFEGVKGDVNDDGTINVLDILGVVNHILGITILDEQGIWRADCNSPEGRCDGDGVINIIDALKIVNIILGNDACGNTRPTASFTVDPVFGTPETTFNVDASGSSDIEDSTSSLEVRWDWENDGIYDTDWSTTKMASHQFSTTGTKTIKLEIQDSGGLTDAQTHQVKLCPQDLTVTDIDGNVYCTVTIGSQVWMSENLKVTHYRNSDPIPHVTDIFEWDSLRTGAYCNYANDPNLATTYGRLYNWYAVSDSRNIAPIGWHVPSDAEWKQLEISLGMNQSQADTVWWRGTDEGGKMKEAGTSHWQIPNTGATNESNFSALPGGYHTWSSSRGFNDLGCYAAFWSSTEWLSAYAWTRSLSYLDSRINRGTNNKPYGHSVRCVRD